MGADLRSRLTDVFAIQSEIAKAIADQLQAQLSPGEKAAIAQSPTNDVIANDLYVRAAAFDDMSNDPGAKGYLLQGVSLLEEALRRDPNFLLAQCLLSEIHSDLYWFGFDHTPARLEESHKALQQAERIQPDAGEVHLQKGVYAYHGFRDYDQALAEFELARKSLPNSSRLYLYLGVIDRRQSRWDDAIRNMNRAVELDPRNFLIVEEAAFTLGGVGHAAEATRLLQRAIELSPKDYFARMQLAMTPYFERGDLEPLRAQLDVFEKEGAEATANASQSFVIYALAKRDPAAAAKALTFIPAEGSIFENTNFLMPRDWFVGLVARTFGEAKEAERAFTAARTIAAKTVQEQPDYAPAWSLLGMIDAGLGRKADAITEGKRACELLPISKDSWEGPIYVTNLALIYVWVGEKDLALEQLARSVKTPGGITFGELNARSDVGSAAPGPAIPGAAEIGGGQPEERRAMNEFLQRLKERKLVQWTVAYVAAAFALLQGIDIVAQRFDWPEQTMRFVIIALSVGLFVTLVLAWYHGERGAQRVTGTELLILALLLAIGGGFLWRFSGTSREPIVTTISPAVAIPKKSIAVLPFENLSRDPDNAYFVDGIQDEILTRLAKISALKVISRTSTMRYASRPDNLREIAKQLGVANILEGSVQRAGGAMRVNVQLIETESDSHLWAESYDRDIKNIFSVESEVAQAVADALKATLLPAESARIANVPTKNPAAYDLFLKGQYLFSQLQNSASRDPVGRW